MQIPDAPWIRAAENDGWILHDDRIPDEIYCPICGRECETIYMHGPDVCGCERCIDVMDSDDWWKEENLPE